MVEARFCGKGMASFKGVVKKDCWFGSMMSGCIESRKSGKTLETQPLAAEFCPEFETVAEF